MHLHFERIEKPSSYCDCSIITLSWMGKVPEVSIGKEEGWKLNRHQYYTDGWLASGNIRGIIGCTFTTCSCRNNNSHGDCSLPNNSLDTNVPLRTNYNLRGHRSEVTIVKWNEPYQKLATCDSSGIIFVWIKYEGRWSIELINDRSMPVVDFNWSHDGRMALICYVDGFILVGSVTGQRYWSSMINISDVGTITSGIWTPDDSYVLFATNIGYVIVINVNGTMINQIKIRPSTVPIACMSWSCEKFKMDDTDDQQQQQQSSSLSIVPFTIGSTSSTSNSSSSRSASNTANVTNNIMINSKNGLEYILAVCFVDGIIYLMKNYDDIVPLIINVNLIGIKMEWSNNGDVLAVAGHHVIKKQSPNVTANGANVSNCCSICCGNSNDEKQSTSSFANLVRNSVNRLNRSSESARNDNQVNNNVFNDNNCNDLLNELKNNESKVCHTNHDLCPHQSSTCNGNNVDLYINQIKFYTPNGKLRYVVKVNFNLNPITAITWGHNDKRIFIATGPVLHIAWITKKLPSLQLLSRLTVFKSLANEKTVQQLQLPSRIQAMISSLFSRTLRCYLPSVSTLRSYVSNPPIYDTRLYCTLIRHDDDLIGGSTTYVLYLEYLGGLVPILKGKRASKLKPEFIIYDPQPSSQVPSKTTANNSLDVTKSHDSSKLIPNSMNYTSNEIVNFYPNTSVVSSSASSSGYSSSSRRASSHDDLDVNKINDSNNLHQSSSFNISCSPFTSRKFANNVSALTNLALNGKQVNSSVKVNKSLYWKSDIPANDNQICSDQPSVTTLVTNVTSTDTESESESILTDEYGHVYSLPSPIMRRKCRRKRRGPHSGQESTQRNNQQQQPQQQQQQAAANIDAIEANDNINTNSTPVSPVSSELLKAESTYLDEMPESVKLILVTSNIWGTKFKIIGLVSWLPSILGTISYRTSVLHLQPRQMTLQIKELGGRRNDAKSFVTTSATNTINEYHNCLRSNDFVNSALQPADLPGMAPESLANSVQLENAQFASESASQHPIVRSNTLETLDHSNEYSGSAEKVEKCEPASVESNVLKTIDVATNANYTHLNGLTNSIDQLQSIEWSNDGSRLVRKLIDTDSSPTQCQTATIAPMTPRKTALRQHQRKLCSQIESIGNNCQITETPSNKFAANVDEKISFDSDTKSTISCSTATTVDTKTTDYNTVSKTYASPRANDELLAQIARQLAAEYSASTVSEANDLPTNSMDQLDDLLKLVNGEKSPAHKRNEGKRSRPIRKSSPGRPLQYPINLSLPPSNDTLDRLTDRFVDSDYSTFVNQHLPSSSTCLADEHGNSQNDPHTDYRCRKSNYDVPLIPVTNQCESSDVINDYSAPDARGYFETLDGDKFSFCKQSKDTFSKDNESSEVSSSTVSSLPNSSSIDTTSPDTSSTSSSVSSSKNSPPINYPSSANGLVRNCNYHISSSPMSDLTQLLRNSDNSNLLKSSRDETITLSSSSEYNQHDDELYVGNCRLDAHESSGNEGKIADDKSDGIFLNNLLDSNLTCYLENSGDQLNPNFTSVCHSNPLEIPSTNGQFMKLLPSNSSLDNENQFMYPRLTLKSKTSTRMKSDSRKRHRHDVDKYLTNVRSINGVIEVDSCPSGNLIHDKYSNDDDSYFNCTYFDCYDDDDDDDLETDEEDVDAVNVDSLKLTDDNGSTVAFKKTHNKSKYRRSSCHCERAILDQHPSADATNYPLNTNEYQYPNSSFLNECIIRRSSNKSSTNDTQNKCKSQYNSSSNIFSTPVHRSSRERAMDYRTYESLVALDSLISETRRTNFRSHSTLGQYSSFARDQIDINDLLVYNVHHTPTAVRQALTSPLSASTSPSPLSFSLCSPPGLPYATGSASAVNQSIEASAPTELSSLHHRQHYHHHHHRLYHQQQTSLGHLLSKRSNNYPIKHKSSYPHIYSDAITLVPVSSDSLNTVSPPNKILQGTSNSVHDNSHYICNDGNVESSTTLASYNRRRSSLQMTNVDVDCSNVQSTHLNATTAVASMIGETTTSTSCHHNCIGTCNVPPLSADCDTLYTNNTTAGTISQQQQQRQHRSLPASPSLEQSRRFISSLFTSHSGTRRNDNRRTGGRSLLSSPRMLKKVIKQKLNYLDCSSSESDLSEDDSFSLNRDFLETLQRSKINGKLSNSSSVISSIVNTVPSNSNVNNHNSTNQQPQLSPVNGANLLKRHFAKHTSKHRRGSRVQPEVEDSINSTGHISSRRRQEEQLREFVLQNKAPFWNELSQVYQLDFGGRVTQESAKNFQIEYQGNQVMQFGRIDGNAYTLDFQYPFCALQALAVALANVTQRLK